MARLSAVAAALAAGAACVSAASFPGDQCDAEYQCIYHVGTGSNQYSWDLRSLCRAPGAEYTVPTADYVPATSPNPAGSMFYFNLCGIVGGQQGGQLSPNYCTPTDTSNSGKIAMYTRGAVVQQFSEAGTPAGMCRDLECEYALKLNPNVGCNPLVKCTNNCEVVAHDVAPTFRLADPGGNVNAGINLSYVGVPWYPNDFFSCPGQDPDTGLQTEREVTIQLFCDKNVKNGLSAITVAEVSTCNYLITARTASACPSKGDPFDPYRDDPAHSFGFVVLGATLTVLCIVVYNYGESKGWWDPIKARMPDIPWLSSRGGVFGGSSYKGLSSSVGASAPATTPISASAYGST